MGVIKPPWIDKDWFDTCPYNYCDHFGDADFLMRVCIICRDTKRETVDEVLLEKSTSLQDRRTDFRLEEGVLPEDKIYILDGNDSFTNAVNTLLYQLQKYGNAVQKIINVFWYLPESQKTELIKKAQAVLSHSRHYAYIKIRRAYSSYLEEQVEKEGDGLKDSKTSALFAYVALERNSRAFFALAREEVISPLNETHLEMAEISLEQMELIKRIFFPTTKLTYTDVGCEHYDACFGGKIKEKRIKNAKH